MTQPSAFFDRLYDSARNLTIEARNYIAYGARAEREHLAPYVALEFSKESTRLTSRLIEIMAWVLTEKAVHAGEISREQAHAPSLGISGQDVNADPSGHLNDELPIGLRDLLQRSHSLYEQVINLDQKSREIFSSNENFRPETPTKGRPTLICINTEQ